MTTEGERPVDGSEAERLDNRFRALLEGLRTTLPGVQVLFGFLLIVPFQTSFADLEQPAEVAYYTAFIATAAASVLLIAPSVHQRVRAPLTGMARRHPGHVRQAVYLTIAGTVAFAIALAASVYLVSGLVFDDLIATVVAAATSVLVAATWFYLPLVAWRRDGTRPEGLPGTTDG
jgi:hypothetical protein